MSWFELLATFGVYHRVIQGTVDILVDPVDIVVFALLSYHNEILHFYSGKDDEISSRQAMSKHTYVYEIQMKYAQVYV